MSKSITGSSANFSTTKTVPTDGDPRNAASVEVSFQRDLDNAVYLYNELVTLGGKRIRRVADITALKAIDTSTGMVDGEIRLVGDGTSFKGIYVYESAGVTAESQPWVIQPTVGSGRWFHLLYSVKGAAGGLATLDPAAGRLVENCRNQIDNYGIYKETAGATIKSTTSTTFSEATTAAVALGTLAVDDLLFVDYSFDIEGSSPFDCTVAIRVKDGASDVDLSETQLSTTSSARQRWSIPTVYGITTGGTVSVVPVVKTNGAGGAAKLIGRGALRVTIVRPG